MLLKDVTEIENVLNKEFVLVLDWFVDNKLSIHLSQGKAKYILCSGEKTCQSLT